MTQTPTRPRPTPIGKSPSPPSTQAAKTLDMKPREARPVPVRCLFYAVGGWGKTTLGAYSERPVIVMAGSETGYDDLLGAGLVPSVPVLPVNTWPETLETLTLLAQGCGDRRTVVVDSASALEAMCQQHVVERDFDGDSGPRGFGSYGKGYQVTSHEWQVFLGRLEALCRAGLDVILLAHATITEFTNPAGANFKRFAPNLYHSEKASVAEPTKNWASAVLFGTYVTVVDVAKRDATAKNIAEQSGKGIGRTDRVVYCERRDAWDAKNRYAMPECIDIPSDPSQVYATVWGHIHRQEANQ